MRRSYILSTSCFAIVGSACNVDKQNSKMKECVITHAFVMIPLHDLALQVVEMISYIRETPVQLPPMILDVIEETT